jgi:hypothetical protein
MPYLNWKEKTLKLEMKVHSETRTALKLSLTDDLIQDLASNLEELFSTKAGELRLQLPDNWVLFWKMREEGGRALVAHPNPEEWVGTLALEPSWGEKIILALAQLKKGESLELNRLFSLATVSNFDLTLSRE